MILLYSVLLFAFWLLISGHFDPLLLSLGGISVLLTVMFIKRMDIFDSESFPFHLTRQLPRYLVFIFAEIMKSNIDVLGRILSFRKKIISPQMIEVPLPQQTDLGRVVYANSITLTPGTVSVELTKDSVLVHALSKEIANNLSTGAMAESIPDKVVEQ